MREGLRILEVVHAFPPHSIAGTELYTYHLAHELQCLGHDVTVLHPVQAPTGTDLRLVRGEYRGIATLELHRGVSHGFPPAHLEPELDAPFERILREQPFDVIHFQHVIALSASWLKVAKRSGAAVVLKLDDLFFLCPSAHLVTSENTYCAEGPESIDKCVECIWRPAASGATPDQVGSLYGLLASRRAYLQDVIGVPDLVHTPSHFVRDLCARYGYANENFRVIRTGIFSTPRVERSPRPAGRIRVGYLGALHARKGILDLLRAIELYLEASQAEQAECRLQFSIHGNVADANLGALVQSAAGAWPGVHYGGTFSPNERERLLGEIDLLVVPSIGENYPFVLREALHAGVPVVATQIAGVPEIVHHGHNGWLYPPGDVEALASILLAVARAPERLDALETGAVAFKTIAADAHELSELFLGLGLGRHALEERLREGTRLLASGSVEAARACFLEARGPHADRPRALLGLGVCSFQSGDLEQAYALFEAAYAIDPDDPDVVVNWALAADKLGRLEALRETIAAAAKRFPEDADLAWLAERVGLAG